MTMIAFKHRKKDKKRIERKLRKAGLNSERNETEYRS